MPAVAPMEDLRAVQTQLSELQDQYPEAYRAVTEVFRKNRKIGYKNICKLMMGEATPEKLKGME